MCGTALITKFISDRKQKNKLIEDKYAAILVMRGMRSCEPDYEVGYHFGLIDYSVSIEFYNEWDMSASASMYMVKIFKEFHKNLSKTKFRFLRTCGFCFRYEMCSDLIDVDLKTSTYSSIVMKDEFFVFATPAEDGVKYVLLGNRFDDTAPKSALCWWRTNRDDYRLHDPIPIKNNVRSGLSFIPFVSKEETGRRLNNLITFS